MGESGYYESGGGGGAAAGWILVVSLFFFARYLWSSTEMYTPDGISRAFKEKGVREPMMADARFYGCGVNHLRTSLHQQQFRVYTRQTVAASYRFAAGGGGRGVGGDRASARNSGTNNKHVGGRKLLSPPTTRGKKKHNGHASLHCYWAAPNGLNRCGYLQPGRSPPTKKKQTITISLFLRWTACNASILSRPFASAANKRIFHLCFKRINGPAPLDWIIVDQLRDEIPLPSLLCTTSVYLFISGSGEEHFNCGI